MHMTHTILLWFFTLKKNLNTYMKYWILVTKKNKTKTWEKVGQWKNKKGRSMEKLTYAGYCYIKVVALIYCNGALLVWRPFVLWVGSKFLLSWWMPSSTCVPSNGVNPHTKNLLNPHLKVPRMPHSKSPACASSKGSPTLKTCSPCP